MHQNTPNYSSNIHFGPPGYPGGASGAQNLKIAVPGGYLKDRIWVLLNFWPIFGHLMLFWWSKLKILTLVVYHIPQPRVHRPTETEFQVPFYLFWCFDNFSIQGWRCYYHTLHHNHNLPHHYWKAQTEETWWRWQYSRPAQRRRVSYLH